MSPLEAIARRVVRPLRDHRAVEELDEFDAAIDIASAALAEKLDAIAAFGETRPSRSSQSMPRGLVADIDAAAWRSRGQSRFEQLYRRND